MRLPCALGEFRRCDRKLGGRRFSFTRSPPHSGRAYTLAGVDVGAGSSLEKAVIRTSEHRCFAGLSETPRGVSHSQGLKNS